MSSTRTIAQIARSIGARSIGRDDLRVGSLAHPALAGDGDLALAMGPAYLDALRSSAARAAVLAVEVDLAEFGLEAAVVVDRPRMAMAGLTRAMDLGPHVPAGIHPTALIDPSARIGADAAIGPYAVIGADVLIGEHARLVGQCTIAEGARIGDHALIHAGVRVGARVRIGDRFVAQPGAVIGGDGFSFVTPQPSRVEGARAALAQPDETPDQSWVRIHSLGAVTLGDDVEIGSNSTIDRGTVVDTSVGNGTKIDNLVHIGHNVRIGRDCLLCGCTGIAGSVTIGDRVVLGGATGVTDNITVGDDVITGAGTVIHSNVPPGRFLGGAPAVKMEDFVAQYKALRRLPRLARTVADLQKALSKPRQSD